MDADIAKVREALELLSVRTSMEESRGSVIAHAALSRIAARIEELEGALKPFAAIEPSSFYAQDGSDGEGYMVLVTDDDRQIDVTGLDLACARAALAQEKADG